MASIFSNVEIGPKIEVFALTKAYLEDTFSEKVNLGIGGKYILFFIFYIDTKLYTTFVH